MRFNDYFFNKKDILNPTYDPKYKNSAVRCINAESGKILSILLLL